LLRTGQPFEAQIQLNPQRFAELDATKGGVWVAFAMVDEKGILISGCDY